ncbi:MAG: hypothetical protein QG590_624, partial [Pseudomonadota bacterium]|nr:hypothetical protein [Pseudomonadota bacterium]
MRILLLDLEPTARESLAKAVRLLSNGGEVWPFRTVEAVVKQLDDRDTDFQLTIIGGDDGDQLLGAFTALAATGNIPPTLIVSACTSVEA